MLHSTRHADYSGRVIFIIRVHSSVARAADCRSAGPWLESGCALNSLECAQRSPPDIQYIRLCMHKNINVTALWCFRFPCNLIGASPLFGFSRICNEFKSRSQRGGATSLDYRLREMSPPPPPPSRLVGILTNRLAIR